MRINSSLVISSYEANNYDKEKNIYNTKQRNNAYSDSISDEIKKYRKNEFKYAEVVKDSNEIYNKYFDKDSVNNLIDEEKYFDNNEIQINKGNSKIESNSDKILENNKYIKNKIDSTELSQNMQKFISDYNSLIDKVKGILSEQKQQKKSSIKEKIDDESIKTALELRRNQENNEKKLKNFIDEIQNALFATISEISNKLNEVGIKSTKENNSIKIEFDENKYKRAIEENGRGVYRLLIGFDEEEQAPIRKLKDTFKKFSNSNISIFSKGLSINSSTNSAINKEDIIKQEEDIKSLIKRMEEKENELGNKLSLLQTDLSKYDKQVGAFNY